MHGVQEFVRRPTRGQCAGYGLAVAHHTRHQQVGIVERGAIGVGQRVTELAALVEGARDFGGHMAGNAAGDGELLEQLFLPP